MYIFACNVNSAYLMDWVKQEVKSHRGVDFVALTVRCAVCMIDNYHLQFLPVAS